MSATTFTYVVWGALILLLASFFFVWLVGRVRYRIGSRYVKVLLFGLVIRRVALSSIDSISKRRGEGWAEHWWSTTRPKHRMLVLRRNRGLFRNVVITPKNRYVFRRDLERALQRIGASKPVSPPDDGDEEPHDSQAKPLPSRASGER